MCTLILYSLCFQILYLKFRLALGPTKVHMQWVLGDVSTGVMWLECEATHSSPSNAKVGASLHLPHMSSWFGAVA
jgi:hypothetical protein